MEGDDRASSAIGPSVSAEIQQEVDLNGLRLRLTNVPLSASGPLFGMRLMEIDLVVDSTRGCAFEIWAYTMSFVHKEVHSRKNTAKYTTTGEERRL